MVTLPLSHLRVVEIGSSDAASYCGKLFSDFGAEVFVVEPPGGDPRRALEPLVEVTNGERESAYFAWLNTNKSSLLLDLDSSSDLERTHALLQSADILLDGRHPAEIASSALSHENLRKTNPGLAITAISWFSDIGPYCDYVATESVIRSLAGLVKLVGPAEGPPMLARDGQAAVLGGLTAFIPTVAGLLSPERGARRFRTSIHEAMLQVSEFDTGSALELGYSRARTGVNSFGRSYPSGPFDTQQGILGVTIVTPAQWAGFCEMIGRSDLARDPRFTKGPDRFAHKEELRSAIAPILRTRAAMEWFELGIRQRLPLSVIPTMQELLAQQFHRERGSFGKVRIGQVEFEAPVLPQRLMRTPPKPDGRAPSLGEPVVQDIPARIRSAQRAAEPQDALPLQGIRVIDLTMGWAGPSGARQLADLGADVIKVESCQYPDWFRGTDTRPPYHEERTYEKTLWVQYMNRNKRGITIDLTASEGVEIFKRLLVESDAVIDNYAADVLPRLGLDTATMLKINPRLVAVTMPAFGSKGVWSEGRAYGSTLEQASGLTTIQGRDTDPPAMTHSAFGDPVGGLNAAAALTLGLMHQRRTGEGQHIDLSQVQCILPMLAASIIEQATTGKTSPRLGNRHPVYVPHGCFPAMGEDQWITIAVRSAREWKALCEAMRRPDLAADPELATAQGRRTHEDQIEKEIKKWTTTVRPDSAMVKLQSVGVPAGIARLPVDLAADPHLVAIGHWQSVDRLFIGPHLIPLVSYREGGSDKPYGVRSAAPTLGQHNGQVLAEILDLTENELRGLEERDVIGNVATATRKATKRATVTA